MAIHAQLLPLQVSLPAASALASVVTALFISPGEQAPPQPRIAPPSAAAVAAAATVIIEDASATLGPHSHAATPAHALDATAAASGSEEEQGQQHLDDLSAALFTFVHSAGDSRPAPLQVHIVSGGHGGGGAVSSGAAAGLGARLWSAASGGSGRQELNQEGGAAGKRRQGVRWCYPHPREVAVLAIEVRSAICLGRSAATHPCAANCPPACAGSALNCRTPGPSPDLQHAPAAVLTATFHLACFSPEAGTYLPLPLQAVMIDSIRPSAPASSGGGDGSKTLLLIAEEAAMAAQWQLSWELSAAAAGAAAAWAPAVLPWLRVNPRSYGQAAATALGVRHLLRVPPPLAASLTVVLTAEAASLALLAPVPLVQPLQPQQDSAAPAALLDTVACLRLGGLKAAVHSYPCPEDTTLLAADLQAHAALCLPDSSSGTTPPAAPGAPGAALLEPVPVDLAVEYSSCPDGFHQQQQLEQAAQQQQQQEQQEEEGDAADADGEASSGFGAGQAAAPPMFWQEQAQGQELALMAVRQPPSRRGLGLNIAALHQPAVINASEASLAEVRQLVGALSTGGGTAQQHAASAHAPLQLANSCGVAVLLRQQGAGQPSQVQLRDGQRLALVWPAPPALVPGTTRRLQLARAEAAEGDESAWSEPFDVSCARHALALSFCCARVSPPSPMHLTLPSPTWQVMACGGHEVLLPGLGGVRRSLAVQVQHGSGGVWEVALRPGLRVVNHLAVPAHLCLACEGASSFGGSSGADAAAARSPQKRQRAQHQSVQVTGGSGTDLLIPDGGSQMRLWLGGNLSGGPGSGWSQAVPMPQQHRRREAALMVLHSSPAAAATATAAGLDVPAAAAAQAPLGSVLAQLLPPDAASGQATLHLWPPLLLHNSMPCALRLLLPAADALQPYPPQLEQQHVEVVVPPGSSRQLAVPLQGGTVGALLALDPAGGGGGPAGGGGSSRGMAIVVPPLIAESAEEQWFGAGGPQSPARGKALPAVFIAPPGEATGLRLPLLLPPRGGAAEAAAAPNGAAEGGGAAGSGKSHTAPVADCLLATQHSFSGLPCMQLSLLPALAVHNCLPVPLLFRVGGGCA